MIKQTIIVIGLILAAFTTSQAQNLIGYTKEEIRDYVTQNEPDFELTSDRKGVGLIYKVYNKDEIGRFFLIGESNLCYAYQIAFPYDKINSVVSDMNELYVKDGKFKWLDYANKVTSRLELIETDSFFVIQRSLLK